MRLLLTTEYVLHEAIASAFGNRQPQSRQHERDEMATASIARTRSRLTPEARRQLEQRVYAVLEDVLPHDDHDELRWRADLRSTAARVVDELCAGDGGDQ